MTFLSFLNSLQTNEQVPEQILEQVPEQIPQEIPGGPPAYFVTIPEFITVHLGYPDQEAENVTVPFVDYIKNVAASELYPTWPENALRANIHAIVSVALNRIVLEWYRSRGYNFDITNTTQYDQAFVYNRGTYENINEIVDEIFNQYVVREGQVIPLFTTFCDGRVSLCDGLHQWGSVDLANEGYTPIEILRYYFGNDISIVTNVPVGGIGLTYPGEPLKLGDSSLVILRQQLGLNRISNNFPAIPKITPVDGFFGQSTEDAVMEFQKIFNLPVTGIIDQATFYKIRQIYVAVTKLAELAAVGSIYEEVYEITREILLQGDIRPRVVFLQYILEILSLFYETIPAVAYTGIFDEPTRQDVIEFQKTMGLQPTGIVDDETWNLLFNTFLGIIDTLQPEMIFLPYIRYPGIDYGRSDEVQPGVFVIQQMLSYISLVIPSIPTVPTNGIFDDATEESVIAFQNMFGLEPTGVVDEATWNELERVYREQRFSGVTAPPQEII
ncbi:MAG TPA: spore cortex-lytic protein [Clostridiales bacterium]|nr:spore cortex-lytic protein [Clostridiales bacterium]